MENLNCSGVYIIENIINEKKYIGSSKNIQKRIKTHFKLLKNNKHHSIYLQNSYNKHGRENFKYYLLEESPINDILNLEQKYLDNIIDWKFSLNISKTARGCSFDLSTHPNELEIRKKISISSMGRGSKPFFINNVKYKTLKDAAIEYCVDVKAISYRLKNWKYKNYYYVDKPKKGEFIDNNFNCYWNKPKIKKAEKKYYCECGNEISINAKNCRKCAGIKGAVNQRKIYIKGIIHNSITEASKIMNISKELLFYRINSSTTLFKDYYYY